MKLILHKVWILKNVRNKEIAKVLEETTLMNLRSYRTMRKKFMEAANRDIEIISNVLCI